MVEWQDGVKISDAYIDENGNFREAEYEGETPLCAANLNLMQEIKTASVVLPKNTTITNGYEVVLPDGLQYQVGNNSLEVRLNGIVLIRATDTQDGHYKEVGEPGELSNKITFYRTAEDGNWVLYEDITMTFVIKGVAQNE